MAHSPRPPPVTPCRPRRLGGPSLRTCPCCAVDLRTNTSGRSIDPRCKHIRVNPFAGLCHTCRIGNLTSSSAAKVHAPPCWSVFFSQGTLPAPPHPLGWGFSSIYTCMCCCKGSVARVCVLCRCVPQKGFPIPVLPSYLAANNLRNLHTVESQARALKHSNH